MNMYLTWARASAEPRLGNTTLDYPLKKHLEWRRETTRSSLISTNGPSNLDMSPGPGHHSLNMSPKSYVSCPSTYLTRPQCPLSISLPVVTMFRVSSLSALPKSRIFQWTWNCFRTYRVSPNSSQDIFVISSLLMYVNSLKKEVYQVVFTGENELNLPFRRYDDSECPWLVNIRRNTVHQLPRLRWLIFAVCFAAWVHFPKRFTSTVTFLLLRWRLLNWRASRISDHWKPLFPTLSHGACTVDHRRN